MKSERGIIKNIRAHCLDCAGNSTREVRLCPITDCNLWPLRFGKGQKAVIRIMGELGKDLLDKSNFAEGAKYGAGLSASELEP